MESVPCCLQAGVVLSLKKTLILVVDSRGRDQLIEQQIPGVVSTVLERAARFFPGKDFDSQSHMIARLTSHKVTRLLLANLQTLAYYLTTTVPDDLAKSLVKKCGRQ